MELRDKIAETVATILSRGLGAAPVERITDAILEIPEIMAGQQLFEAAMQKPCGKMKVWQPGEEPF